MSSLGDPDSIPSLPPDSPGSSVSSHFQQEYDELLKYAVVMPNYNPKTLEEGAEGGTLSQPEHNNPDTIITITSQARDATERKNDSRDTDTLVDSSHASSNAPRSTQGSGSGGRKSPVMRDIFPELTDDDVYTRPDSLYSGQDTSQHSTQQERGHPSEQTYPRSEQTYPRSEQTYPRSEQTYPRSEQTYPRSYHMPPTADSFRNEPESVKDVRHIVTTTTIDPDVGRMENLLDQWCQDLKKNVLAEYGQSKIKMVEMTRIELQKEKARHAAELNQVRNEMENLKELLCTYEQSVERKDQVISNLTNALQKNKEKFDMMKKFTDWKIRHNEAGKEAFASNLANIHYQRKLCQKVWAGWHSVIETKWKQRVEKACQAKAQQVCLNVTNEYEAKLAALNEALDSAREEVARLHKERDRYEEQMKKAFMRGVCALNLEAMTIFQGGEEDSENGVESGGGVVTEEQSYNFESSLPPKDHGLPKTIPKESVQREAAQKSKAPSRGAGVQQASAVRPATGMHGTQASSRPQSRTKTFSTRITSQVESSKVRIGGPPDLPTLAPPVSTVMVERHQPVVKQTIGHAIANKYPKDGGGSGGARPTVHRKIAGQTGPLTPHIQSVKVVD